MSAARRLHDTPIEIDPTAVEVAPSGAGAAGADTPAARVVYERGVGLVVHNAVIDAPEVEAEALRWATGARGDPISLDELDGTDLAAYHRTTVCLGARVLQATGDCAASATLAATVSQLAEKAEAAGASIVNGATAASTQVVEVTAKAAKEATEATAKIIDAAQERFAKDLADGVGLAMAGVQRDIERLLGGEGSQAVVAIRDVIARAMGEAQVSWHRSLTTTLTEVNRTLDVSNPGSPLGALERRMVDTQERQHAELTGKLDDMQALISAAAAAASTAAAVSAVQQSSPAKGVPYQAAVGSVLEVIASAMACSYEDTSTTVGLVKACKKGDAVIEAPNVDHGGRAARVVVEVTTQSQPRAWSQYLQAAAANRSAQVALGVVPSCEMVPGGGMLAIVGPSRMVVAFNPEDDDPGLLRAALQILILEAQRLLAQDRSGDLALVDARLSEARLKIVEIGEVIKTAVTVRNGAGRVVTALESLQGSLSLIIEQARAALGGNDSAAINAA